MDSVLEAINAAKQAADTYGPVPWTPERVVCKARGCNELILKVETRHGNLLPLNAEPDPAGNVILVYPLGSGAPPVADVLGPARANDPAYKDLERWMPHFATCPAAKRFRKRARVHG